MSNVAVGLGQQLLRRKPIIFQRKHHTGEELTRNLGTFQLMMFGVGATVGTGIFFVERGHPGRWSRRDHLVHRGCRLRRPVRALLRGAFFGDPGERIDLLVHPTPWAKASPCWWVAACSSSTASRPRPSRSAGAATSTSCWITCSGSSCPTPCRHRSSRVSTGSPPAASSTCRRLSW